MDKVVFLTNNKTCIINGKRFDVKYHAPFDGTTISIEGTGNQGDRFQQHITVGDFKGIRVADLPIGVSISVYPITASFEYFRHWYLNNRAKGCTLTLIADFYYRQWNEPVNLNIFLESLKIRLKEELPQIDAVDLSKDPSDPALSLSTSFELSAEDDLYEITQAFGTKVKEHFDELILTYRNHGSSSPLVVRFQFPHEVESACEQYLAYFAEFLRDLGIEANTELLRNGSEVLFSVIPVDRNEALHRIKDALGLYLQLPKIYDQQKESSSRISPETDVVIQKYVANIEHLRSQLRLAEALINAKGLWDVNPMATLITIQNNVFETSLRDVTIRGTTEDTKSFFGGIFKLGSWKKGPVEISTPKLLDGLRKLIGKLRE